MKKRILLMALAFVMLVSMVPNAFAASAEPEIMPMFNYTLDYEALLSISGGTASCRATLDGIPGTTTRINAEMILQKKGLFGWSEAWSSTYGIYTHTLDHTETASVGNGTYRLKVVFTVYSGTASETITAYSSEVKA